MTATAQPEQMTIDLLYPCPTCDGAGRTEGDADHQPGPCKTCMGAGTVSYDPNDTTIPY